MRIESKDPMTLVPGDIIRLYTNWELVTDIHQATLRSRLVWTDEGRKLEFTPMHVPVTVLVKNK